MTQLENYVMNLEYQLEFKQQSLRDSAVNLARDLNNLTKALDEGGSFNTLGVVQGQGAEIDRLCGEVTVLIGTIKALKFVANAE